MPRYFLITIPDPAPELAKQSSFGDFSFIEDTQDGVLAVWPHAHEPALEAPMVCKEITAADFKSRKA